MPKKLYSGESVRYGHAMIACGGLLPPTSFPEGKWEAQSMLYLPCGLLRGAMHHLGVVCDVTASMTSDDFTLPAVAFTVRIPQS